MKEIKAYIRRDRVNQTVEKLREAGAPGITIVDIHPVGYGYEPNYFEAHHEGVFERYKHLSIVKLEVVCGDEVMAKLVQVVLEQCRTGDKGDGMIFVSDVSEAIRIRDGARGKKTL